MKILIVDDDPESRKLLRLLVESHGHGVIEASDGQEGLEKALQYKPDVIISDTLMPRMDGFQFLMAVRQDETLSAIPFVFFTAIYTDDKEYELALSLGADALIVKPKKPDDFWKEFTAALEKHASSKGPAVKARPDEKGEERFRDYCRLVSAKLEEKVRELEMVIADNERTKTVLLESEERYRLLFESNPHPMWVYDLQTLAFLAVNEAAIYQYGYSREEFFSMTIKDIRPVEDIPALLEKVSKVPEGFDEAGLWRHLKKDRTIIDVEITSHPMTFAGRRAELILANDVTERRLLEQEIESAAGEWRSTFDAMSDAILLMDLEGKIHRCNRAMADLVGKDFSEIIGRQCWEIVHGTSIPIEMCPRELMKKTCKKEAIVLQAGPRWFEVSVDPQFDSEGKLLGAVHIMTDVTEHKHMEDEIRKALVRAEDEKARADSIIAAIGDGITIHDRDFRILYQNQAAKNMVGDHVGELCFRAYEKREKRCEGCPVAMVFEDGKVHTVERSVPTDKGMIYLENTASPLRDSRGNIIAGIEVVHNITERKRAEETLQLKQYMLSEAQRIAHIGSWDVDTRTDKITWSNEMYRIYGVSPDTFEHTTEAFLKLIHPEDRSAVRSQIEGIIARGIESELDFRILWPDGSVHYVRGQGEIFLDETGKPVRAIGAAQDITERKILDEQLFQITQEWEETFNTITDMVTVHDKDFNIIRANKAAEKILGLPFLEMKKVKCFEYYHGTGCPPEDCPSCLSLVTGKPSTTELFEPHLKMYIEIQAIPRLDSNNEVVGLIHVVRDISERKKSEEALASYSRELTELNTASNTLMLITNLGDIYQEICNIIYEVFDLKMVWLGLIEEGSFQVKPVAYAGQEDGYLSAIRVTWDDSATGMGPTGMSIKTKEPVNTTVNDQVFGPWKGEAEKRGYVSSMSVPLVYARDKCLGALSFYSEAPDYFTPDRMKLCQIFANQAAIAIENAQLVSGLEVEVSKRTRALEDTNSELQQLNKELYLRREEADVASRSKTDFLANMSHELRTPLNSIMGFADIIKQGMAGPVTERQKEFLNDISESGMHLLTLITDILDLSKIEAGKTVLEPETFTVKELIESSLLMFKEKALKHAIKVTTEIDDTLTSITADSRKLKQVMLNLLSNAFKFTPDGGSVRVSARKVRSQELGVGSIKEVSEIRTPNSKLPEGARSELITQYSELDTDFIEISVADTGIGISEENLQRLFQPFQQLETSLTRKYAGTGLGLSLCRRFIELHGGRIWAESEPGKGSRFTFIIPMKQ